MYHYLYNAFGSRAHSFYGNAEVEKEKRPIHKHYSADGSVEIKEDKTKGSINFLFYLGGDPYSAPAVYNSNGEEGKLLFLHCDQLGSIVAITDLNGKLVEARHFDAWGKVLSITDGNGNKLENLLLDRGFTGHEHLQTVGLINMNARLYDPALHRFLQPDNYIQDPFNTQNFNRYGYCLNNPLVYVDENGEFLWAAVIIGAIFGAYTGGTLANNGEANPLKWNFSDNWGYIIGGTIVGAISGYIGGYLAGLQIPMANTIGIAGGSLVNSVGTWAYTEGKTEISISFGAASFNFNRGSFGYLFKKGNSIMENIGYGLGAMANLADLGETGKLLLNTEKKDIINHSAILDENGNVIISEGPGKNWIEPKGSVDHYLNRTLGGSGATNRYPVLGENVTINKVNLTAIKTYGKVLDFLTKNGDGILPYSFVYSSCSTHTGLALNLAGIPTLFIHPYTVQGSVWLWNKSITPSIINNSYHLQNQRK